MLARTDYYSIRFDADPVQLIFFRFGLDRWLETLRWPERHRDDVMLAVSEACTNAVQHAYPAGDPGEVEVIGRLVVGLGRRHLVVSVRDWGEWRPEQGTGFGLTTVHACMARVKIKRDGDGTLVSMTSRPVAAGEREDGSGPVAAHG